METNQWKPSEEGLDVDKIKWTEGEADDILRDQEEFGDDELEWDE